MNYWISKFRNTLYGFCSDSHKYECVYGILIFMFWFTDIDGDFKMQLLDLAPLLLHSSKLIVKTINGNSVMGKDLLEYFKV